MEDSKTSRSREPLEQMLRNSRTEYFSTPHICWKFPPNMSKGEIFFCTTDQCKDKIFSINIFERSGWISRMNVKYEAVISETCSCVFSCLPNVDRGGNLYTPYLELEASKTNYGVGFGPFSYPGSEGACTLPLWEDVDLIDKGWSSLPFIAHDIAWYVPDLMSQSAKQPSLLSRLLFMNIEEEWLTFLTCFCLTYRTEIRIYWKYEWLLFSRKGAVSRLFTTLLCCFIKIIHNNEGTKSSPVIDFESVFFFY